MSKQFFIVAVVACAPILAACGTTYTKAGAGPEQVAADKQRCTKVTTWTRWGYESRRYTQQVREVDPACMRELGYTVSGGFGT